MANAASHNGGRSQTNFNFLQIGGEYPFLNLLKTAQIWSYIDNSGQPLPTELDSDGYLLSQTTVTNHGGIYTRFYLPTQTARSGDYVVKWDGNGTIYFGQSQTPSGGSVSADKTSTGGSGRYVFTPGTDICDLGIAGVGSPRITNLRICHINDESNLDAGQVFGTDKFKPVILAANWGVYRFMNWQAINTSNATSWASLKPTSYVFYEGSEFRSGLYAGSATLASTTKYSVSAPTSNVDGTAWAGLADKATVHLQFASAFSELAISCSSGVSSLPVTAHGLSVDAQVTINSDNGTFPGFTFGTRYYVSQVVDANHIRLSLVSGGSGTITPSGDSTGTVYLMRQLTLNVGGTGDIQIRDAYSNYLDKYGTSFPVTGKFATVVYDATLNVWIKQGGDSGLGSIGINNGCPPQLCLQLAAEMGAHAWFCIPHLACDPITDFVTTLAAYCRDNAPSWMIPRFEPVNELWNTHGGFYHTTYANNKASAYGWTGGYSSWYGKVASVLGQAIASTYSIVKANVKTQQRYQMLLGLRTMAGSGNGVSECDERAESTEYVGQAAAAQSPYLKEAACGWVTHMACAQYWNPSYQGTQTETDLATQYAATPTNATAYAVSESANFNGHISSIPALATVYSNWKAWCLARSIPITKMCGYEGCYSPDYSGPTNVDLLRFASRMNPNLAAHTIAVYYNFTKLSDSTFTAEFPSNFIIGDYTSSGSAYAGVTTYVWAVFQGDIYATQTPQYTAICSYNAAARARSLQLRIHG